MSLSNLKSGRDGVWGALGTLVGFHLYSAYGIPAEVCVFVAGAVTWFTARNYRVLRASNTGVGRYLRAIDPPAGATEDGH